MAIDIPGPTSHAYFSQRLRLHYVDWGNGTRRRFFLFMVVEIIAGIGIGSQKPCAKIGISLLRTCAVTVIRSG